MRISNGLKLTFSFLLAALLVGVLGFLGFYNIEVSGKQVDVRVGAIEEGSDGLVVLTDMKPQIIEGIVEAFAYPLLNDPLEKSVLYEKLSGFNAFAASLSESASGRERGQEEGTELFNQKISAEEPLARAAGNLFESYEPDGPVNPSYVAEFEAEIDYAAPLTLQLLKIENEEVVEAQQEIQATIASEETQTITVVTRAVVKPRNTTE